MLEIVYFSNYSGNTERFVNKFDVPSTRIPIKWDEDSPVVMDKDYVLFVPTYGGGNEHHTVPRQVVWFLNIPQNREYIRGVVGLGNTNFGEHYCKAAEIVSAKTGVPLLYRVEILGTPDDVEQVTERMAKLWTISTATTN
jgi:protein involved in ribonucleotide reduction